MISGTLTLRLPIYVLPIYVYRHMKKVLEGKYQTHKSRYIQGSRIVYWNNWGLLLSIIKIFMRKIFLELLV